MNPKKSIMSRYSTKIVNPQYYGSIDVANSGDSNRRKSGTNKRRKKRKIKKNFRLMALSHYHITLDPVYKNSFEVHYITNDLSEEEKIVLLSNTYKIEKNFIYLHINTNDANGIPVFKYLTKLKKFCIMVLVHNKIGHIIGKFIYTNCSFPNLEEDMVDFSWQENDDILTPKIEIKYENLEYVDLEDFKRYDRQKKLERLLNEE